MTDEIEEIEGRAQTEGDGVTGSPRARRPAELSRLTRITVRYARRFGVSAAVYADSAAFDVLTERKRVNDDGETTFDGILWIKRKTRDVYLSPAAVAFSIRRAIRDAWA